MTDAARSNVSPFERPSVSHGYPLEKAEREALTRALTHLEEGRSNGDQAPDPSNASPDSEVGLPGTQKRGG